jgi:hypothetical protein
MDANPCRFSLRNNVTGLLKEIIGSASMNAFPRLRKVVGGVLSVPSRALPSSAGPCRDALCLAQHRTLLGDTLYAGSRNSKEGSRDLRDVTYNSIESWVLPRVRTRVYRRDCSSLLVSSRLKVRVIRQVKWRGTFNVWLENFLLSNILNVLKH